MTRSFVLALSLQARNTSRYVNIACLPQSGIVWWGSRDCVVSEHRFARGMNHCVLGFHLVDLVVRAGRV